MLDLSFPSSDTFPLLLLELGYSNTPVAALYLAL